MAIKPAAQNLWERIDRTSPSNASFQIDGASASMDFIIDKENTSSLISDILGSVYKAGDGTGRLIRNIPAAHPKYDWLYATRITNIEGLQPYGREEGISNQAIRTIAPEINYIYDYTTYKKYKVQVQFEPRPYLVLPNEYTRAKQENKKWYYNLANDSIDFIDPKEWMRFIDIECEPSAEFLSSPQGQFQFKTSDASAPNGQAVTNQNGGGINLLVVKRKIKVTWFFVPYEIVFAENVTSGFGKVNQYDFLGFPKGSMLLEGTEIKRYPPPEQQLLPDFIIKDSVPQKLCDITFVFSCMMQPEKDLSTKIPASTNFKIAYGHNLLPRAGELKYYYVEADFNGRPVYESYPMERLFRLD